LENAHSKQQNDIEMFIEKIEMSLVNSRRAQRSNYTSTAQHKKLHQKKYGIFFN